MSKPFRTNLDQHKRIIAGVSVAIGAGILGLFLLSTNASVAQAFKLATTHQPERFTQLYFNHNRLLPTAVTAGSEQKFSFHITNHEAQTVTYPYAVVETAGSVTSVVKQSAVTLQDGAGADQVISYSVPSANEVSITVELLGRPEVINFRAQS